MNTICFLPSVCREMVTGPTMAAICTVEAVTATGSRRRGTGESPPWGRGFLMEYLPEMSTIQAVQAAKEVRNPRYCPSKKNATNGQKEKISFFPHGLLS